LSHCILVAEDNPLNRELLCDWLEVEGYEVWSAADLTASYEVFSKRVPDAVLLDIDLDKHNGLDLLGWMQQEPLTREIPVIAVTAHALITDRDLILKAGCKACLSKPIDFKLLRAELGRWLQDSRTPATSS
jgi:two-component system cell cycle response regulator DivK